MVWVVPVDADGAAMDASGAAGRSAGRPLVMVAVCIHGGGGQKSGCGTIGIDARPDPYPGTVKDECIPTPPSTRGTTVGWLGVFRFVSAVRVSHTGSSSPRIRHGELGDHGDGRADRPRPVPVGESCRDALVDIVGVSRFTFWGTIGGGVAESSFWVIDSLIK